METRKPLEIIIAPENRVEFQDIYLICRTYRDISKPIPASVVFRLYEIMDSVNGYNLSRLISESKLFSKRAVEKMASMRGYQLFWKEKIQPGSNDKVKPDSEQVFAEMIYLFSLYKKDHKKAGRDEAIAFFYFLFDEDYRNKLRTDFRKKFTIYKQSIISGILAQAMGFQLTSKKNPCNADIFQATRNAISKYYED